MKQVILRLCFLFLCIMFIACDGDVSKQDDLSDIALTTRSRIDLFSGTKYIEEGITTRGVANPSKLWEKNQTIRVKFLNGSINSQELVKKYASEWLSYIDLRFLYVSKDEDADVRIVFSGNEEIVNRYVSWSYTGTDAKKITDQNVPTANLAFFEDMDTESQKGETLRLFGQILGLELEHRHLSADPKWTSNINRIKDYWTEYIMDIPWTELKRYVFDPIENVSNIIQTKEFDPNSIMLWQFPRSVSLSPNLWKTNYSLSNMDIKFIQSLYSEGYEILGADTLYLGSENVKYTVKLEDQHMHIVSARVEGLPYAEVNVLGGGYVGAAGKEVRLTLNGANEPNLRGELILTLDNGKVVSKYIQTKEAPSIQMSYIDEYNLKHVIDLNSYSFTIMPSKYMTTFYTSVAFYPQNTSKIMRYTHPSTIPGYENRGTLKYGESIVLFGGEFDGNTPFYLYIDEEDFSYRREIIVRSY